MNHCVNSEVCSILDLQASESLLHTYIHTCAYVECHNLTNFQENVVQSEDVGVLNYGVCTINT